MPGTVSPFFAVPPKCNVLTATFFYSQNQKLNCGTAVYFFFFFLCGAAVFSAAPL